MTGLGHHPLKTISSYGWDCHRSSRSDEWMVWSYSRTSVRCCRMFPSSPTYVARIQEVWRSCLPRCACLWVYLLQWSHQDMFVCLSHLHVCLSDCLGLVQSNCLKFPFTVKGGITCFLTAWKEMYRFVSLLFQHDRSWFHRQRLQFTNWANGDMFEDTDDACFSINAKKTMIVLVVNRCTRLVLVHMSNQWNWLSVIP